MLLSLALIFLLGMALGKILEKLGLPQLLGMLLTGILLGPYGLALLDPALLLLSPLLRQIALIIILTRAGLNLDLKDLKKVGRPAILMCFLPATLEILGMVLLAPPLLGISLLDAAILGTVIAAVSPAVVVPRMLKAMEEGYGRKKSIPQMIMAGASVDDVYVIVLFTAFMGLAKTGTLDPRAFLAIPTSILLGLAGGIASGLFLTLLFRRFHVRDTGKTLILLSLAFLLLSLEEALSGTLAFSGLLAIILLLGVLIFRLSGVFLSLVKTPLNGKERLFAAKAYLPKATVQAAIGGLPLAMGLASGELILAVAVTSIFLTAPLGALLVDHLKVRLLGAPEGSA